MWDSTANFIYLQPKISNTVKIDDLLTSLTEQLLQMGTLVRQTGGGLRITIGTPTENAHTLMRMKTVLDEFEVEI